MSWNALSLAAELGINRVAMASSVNCIGMSGWWCVSTNSSLV